MPCYRARCIVVREGQVMACFTDIPEFETLDADSISRLDDGALSAAGCTSLDLLQGNCPGGIAGMLELLDAEEIDQLHGALWSVHLAPHIRRTPDADPWPDAAAHQIEECAAALMREAIAREAAGRGSLAKTLAGLGDDRAFDLAVEIEDWRDGVPAPQ